jgi:hypothetical protein
MPQEPEGIRARQTGNAHRKEKPVKEYCYCSVQPKGMSSVYSYLADEGMDIRIGTPVEVPFGHDNVLTKGLVVDFGYYTEDNAPWPVEKTKKIIRVLSPEEYESDWDENQNGEAAGDESALSEDDKKEIAEAMGYILSGNYDEMFKWAVNHHDRVDCPGIMKVVCSCYQLCVEQNNPVAALNLGTLYYTGDGVPQNFKRAKELYEIAAAAGEVRAICNLGYVYYYGRCGEVDYAKAFQCFNLGAVLYDDPNCLYKLGDMYRDGLFVTANGKYAFQLYLRALQEISAPNADHSCAPDIQFRLGRELVDGDIVTQNAENGLSLLTEALSGFYARRKSDAAVPELIQKTKDLILKAEKMLDADME